jgi:hypothetical protein
LRWLAAEIAANIALSSRADHPDSPPTAYFASPDEAAFKRVRDKGDAVQVNSLLEPI